MAQRDGFIDHNEKREIKEIAGELLSLLADFLKEKK